MELKNDHNVYILGAGFSCDRGLPLVHNFLLQMRDSHGWLVAQERTEEANAVKRVLEFRREAASAAYWVTLDLENIEELFSLASASTGAPTDDIRLAIAATLDYAYSVKSAGTCELQLQDSDNGFFPGAKKLPRWMRQMRQPNPVQHDPGLYSLSSYAFYTASLLGMFADWEPKGENSFITFNYDTLLEESLHELGIGFSYELLDDHSARQDGCPSIPILKLHGSVNWSSLRGEHKPLRVQNNYRELRSGGGIPEIVPPTWKKTFDNGLGRVWDTSIRSLTSATRIIIIGFSMPPTDMHFKYLLAAGLQNNVSLRQIVFVNPGCSSGLQARAAEVLRKQYIDSNRITFENYGLRDFLTSPGTLKDKLGAIGRPRKIIFQHPPQFRD